MRLALIADAERRTIERALHDGVQQLLVTLAASIELAAASVTVDPAAASTLLADSRSDVQQALEETRRLADRIYPPLLEAGGLGVALRSAAAGVGLPIRIDVDVGRACPPAIAGAMYLVCLDVLEGADARTSVAVSVREAEGKLSFEIVADGDINTELPSRDPVEALGGRLTIRQGSGHQIRVVGSLPLSG